MAQMVSPGGPRSALSGVLTVADLLKRNETVPVARDAARSATARVSVSNLLRRESIIGGKAAPKDSAAAKPAADNKPAAFASGKRVARGSAIAVGTLLTAGSVFGSVAVTETAHTTANEGLGAHPGQGRLDPGAATPQGQLPGAAAALALPPTAAGVLDAGVAAPDSWTPVAFPSAQAAAPASTPAATGAQGAAASTPDRSSTPSTANHRQQAPAPAAAAPAAPAPQAQSQPQEEQKSGGLVGGLSDTVNGLGDTAPVLAPVTDLVAGGNDNNSDNGSGESSRSSAPSNSSSNGGGGGGLLGSLGKAVGGLLG